jgi:outer membrane protein assembly factor BamB
MMLSDSSVVMEERKKIPWVRGIILFLLFSLFSCEVERNWLTYRGVLGQAQVAGHFSPPLAIKWKLDLQEEDSEDRQFNSPVVEDGIMYFGSPDANFYAFDINTGFMRWIYKTNGPVNSFPLVMEDRVVFGSSDGHVYCVSKSDGAFLWSHRTFAEVNSTVTSWDGKIFTASDNGQILLFSKDGALLRTMRNPGWSYMTFVMDGDVVHHIPFPTMFGGLGAYNLREERYLWPLKELGAGTSWVSSPVIDEHRSYYTRARFEQGTVGRAPGVNVDLYALDKETGETVWWKGMYDTYGIADPRTELPREYTAVLDYLAPALYQNHLIVTNGTWMVRAFHRDSGDIVWERRFDAPTTSSPVVVGDQVFFGIRGVHGRNSWLVCLSAIDGGLLWEVEVEGDIMSAPVVAGKWMVFGTTASQLYVLEEVF